ncbi:hypothetical protein GA0116948_101539 [Chitinophaga costaii]|uniref:Uncharacterized protein n=1 Tax=Chitinophaga costaii TaxID=1335309 RepID=A0A1C3ZTC6_9BACT|nr:hypothetical protein [Chitinophaga costaii]PUZ30492.1 hypothetical protein DCM91_03235 [Chitinophaga costaii]SCB85561.1 hypothetical protein GA0116948_101539 [Chitinophaga costaii]
MNYQKCDSCKNYNLLTSEYLVFCNHCGKKLNNNFSDWQVRHPYQDFSQFIQQVAISSEQIEKSKSPFLRCKQKLEDIWMGNRRQLVMVSVFILLLVAITGTIFGKRMAYNIFYPKVPKAWRYTAWQENTIGRQAITISTPVKLSVHDIRLLPELRESVTYSKNYSNENNREGIDIALHLYSFKTSVINSQDAIVNSPADPLGLLKHSPGVSNLTVRIQRVAQADIPGYLEEGTYRFNGAITLAYRHLVLIREQDMWQVNLVFRADDELASVVADRVLRSIKIK